MGPSPAPQPKLVKCSASAIQKCTANFRVKLDACESDVKSNKTRAKDCFIEGGQMLTPCINMTNDTCLTTVKNQLIRCAFPNTGQANPRDCFAWARDRQRGCIESMHRLKQCDTPGKGNCS